MQKILRNWRGFTLIEVMMVAALLGIFLSILYAFLNFNFSMLDANNERQDARLQARIAMSETVSCLKQYQVLEDNDEGDENKIKGYTDWKQSEEVVLALDQIIGNEEIDLQSSYFNVKDDIVEIHIQTKSGFCFQSKVRKNCSYSLQEGE
ncbi:MAG: type II secretion system GspH family protein [Clostridiales bacterium]|nr:type II secretion system GspH family protein [Clostridiales bacterium]MCF8021147.1 type II secretion system GspH family protein [Clostridiales bacterium]